MYCLLEGSRITAEVLISAARSFRASSIGFHVWCVHWNKDSFSKVPFPHLSDLSGFHLNLTFWQYSLGKNWEGWILSEFDLKAFLTVLLLIPFWQEKKWFTCGNLVKQKILLCFLLWQRPHECLSEWSIPWPPLRSHLEEGLFPVPARMLHCVLDCLYTATILKLLYSFLSLPETRNKDSTFLIWNRCPSLPLSDRIKGKQVI